MKYEFTDDQIKYIYSVKKTGRISTAQGDKIQAIFRTQINPAFNMCTSGCGQAIRRNFANLIGHVERSIGCRIEEYIAEKDKPQPKPQPKKKPKAKKKVTTNKKTAKK